jgi:hypothetical protein
MPWGRTDASLSLDATGVGMQANKAAAAEGRMADVGLIFNPAAATGKPTLERVLAGRYELPAWGTPMRRQGAQVGMERAEVGVALTDGGAGLEEFVQVYFPPAQCVLDLCHAAEHRNNLGKAFDADEAQAQEASAAWCHPLKHEGGQALLTVLEALDVRGRKGEVEAACKSLVGQRLKVGGMRWGEEGADAVCHRRALFKSEQGQGEAFWGNVAA